MNPDAIDEGVLNPEEELKGCLITLYRLSEEQIQRIEQEMLAKRLSFGAAAVTSEVITKIELDKAINWVEEIARRSRWGVIESALRRAPIARTVTLKHSQVVKPGPMLTLVQDPYHPRSELIRSLRTELLMFESRNNRANALAIMSPGPGEGRSLLAAELAIAFAQLGRRTLLVDADLRRPGQHSLFGAENTWGLAQALAFSESPRLLGVEGLPQLSLLTSGLIAPNPLELLSDGRFERKIAEWRRNFDFLVLDTPPVSEYSDGLAIATIAGRVLVVSRAASTAHGEMKEMLRRLGSAQAQILGAVLNHF